MFELKMNDTVIEKGKVNHTILILFLQQSTWKTIDLTIFSA